LIFGPAAGDIRVSRYLDRQEQLLKDGISVESDGQSVALATLSRRLDLQMAPGPSNHENRVAAAGTFEKGASAHNFRISTTTFQRARVGKKS